MIGARSALLALLALSALATCGCGLLDASSPSTNASAEDVCAAEALEPACASSSGACSIDEDRMKCFRQHSACSLALDEWIACLFVTEHACDERDAAGLVCADEKSALVACVVDAGRCQVGACGDGVCDGSDDELCAAAADEGGALDCVPAAG